MKEKRQGYLEPFQIKDLNEDHRLGMTIDTLAARYEVNRRTIYRYLNVKVELHELNGWYAWFAVERGNRPPQRLTSWNRTAA